MSPPDEGREHGGAAPGARARLHGISRHFLSDEDIIFRLALYAEPDDPPLLIADRLARALAGRGRTVACLDTAAGLIALIRPEAGRDPSPERLPEAGHLLAALSAPEIMILTAPAAAITACDLALFAIPAHANGLRSAYLRLKTLARSDRLPRIGITLTGTHDYRDAALRFNKFAVAARDFLGIEVASYSHLPDDEADRHRIDASLDDIARLLLEDWRAARTKQRNRDHHQGQDEPVSPPQHATS